MKKIAAVAVMSLLFTPSIAKAQFAFADKLLDRVTDASIFTVVHGPFGTGRTEPDGLVTRQGFGFELLFSLGRSSGGAVARADTSYTVTERQVTYSRGDSVVVVKYSQEVKPRNPVGVVVYELGVSYVEVPFSVGSAANEMRGAVRGLPMVSVYATRLLGSPYAYGGVRAGLNTLTGVRGYYSSAPDSLGRVANKVVKGGGDAMHAGLLGGLGISVGRLSAYVDVEVARRAVASVQWESDLPDTFPRRIQFSPVTLSLGAQFGSGSRVFSKD